MKTYFKSPAIYVSGLPVGKEGLHCTFSVTDKGLHFSQGMLGGKQEYDIPWDQVKGARIESSEKLTLSRVLLIGILAPLWKKKQLCLVISYGPENFVTDLILAKLNVQKAQQAILKAKTRMA